MASHSLSGFLEPLYTLAKYSGILPLDEDLLLSERWWKVSFLILMSMAAKTFIVRMFLWNIIKKDGRNYLSISIEVINQSISMFILIGHGFSIYRFKNKLKNFGRTVSMLSEGYCYKLQAPTVYTTLGIMIMLVLLAMGISKSNDKLFYTFYIIFIVSEIVIYLIIMSFCTFLEMIHQHFKDIINDINSKSLELATEKSLVLISACEDLSEIYGLPLLFGFLRCLVEFVIIGHSMAVDLNYFDDRTIEESLKSLIHSLVIVIHMLYSVLMITGSCRKIQTSLNRFNVLVFREFRRRPNLVNNNALKLYITNNPSVNFTACGLFSIDNSLVTSILATGITYVVIFVQFNMPKLY